MRYIWSFIFIDRSVGSTAVNDDNKEAIHLANNPVTTSNGKHIDVCHHVLRERVTNGELRLSMYRRHSSVLTFSPKRCLRRRFVFTVTLSGTYGD